MIFKNKKSLDYKQYNQFESKRIKLNISPYQIYANTKKAGMEAKSRLFCKHMHQIQKCNYKTIKKKWQNRGKILQLQYTSTLRALIGRHSKWIKILFA
jgi:hypothetical protein